MNNPSKIAALLMGALTWSCSGNNNNNGRVAQPAPQANGHYADAAGPSLSYTDGGVTPYSGGLDAGVEWDEELPPEERPFEELPEPDEYETPEPFDPGESGQRPLPGDPLDPSSPAPGDPIEPVDPIDPIDPTDPVPPVAPPVSPDLPR